MQWSPDDLWDPYQPHPDLPGDQHHQHWLFRPPVEVGPKRNLAMLFGLCDAIKGVSQVLNPLIVITWIQFMLVGLRMLSTCLHLALLCLNLSVIRLQVTVSDEF